MKAKSLVPLALFLVLVVFLAVGLNRDPHEVPSPLIDKPAPDFKLTQLQYPDKSLALSDMKGQVWLLNVWASWCVACRQEHTVLLSLAQRKLLPVIGLNYKDQRSDGLAWLKTRGDPYSVSIVDSDGRVGIDYGVYGVPESFLIDRNGRIRYKQIGPLTDKVLNEILIPKIQELQHAG